MTRQVTPRARTGGFVRTVVAELDGRRVVRVDAAGPPEASALTPADGDDLAAAAAMAAAERLPLVIDLASSGAHIAEGVAALHGWGRAARQLAACSGVVPISVIVSGPTVSGPALLLGLADLVVMTEDAYAFVSGPRMVEQFTGVPVAKLDLGGVAVHRRTSGVATAVVADRAEADAVLAEILSHLPDHTDAAAPVEPTTDPATRDSSAAYDVLPASANGSYDVRDVLTELVDHGWFSEFHPDWAANLVTGLARIDGRPVGIVANQPQTVAGTLDIAASRKGARFVAFCDAFNVALLTVVDTSGFYPGKDTEWRGMIRYGAQMAFAYARATVPRVNLTTRKSYGGAYIVMDSKQMGNDIAMAWPSAEIAVMGAKGAVEILHRRADADQRLAAEADYEERLLNPWVAAERGTIDAVIEPAETRHRIAAAFAMLADKRETLPRRRHDNTPM